ncbi:Transcriptional regulator, GntR family protein [Candidatus Filomicrobium marinum]|uniref:Transcriptional regulator, GntR family protein n=2 Tax=Filomicrobium TaxID=119044 RepID=A0A0D6JJT9_9HYPH|nr:MULTISPECIES: GntR family transcriptional regulator [Filomicrobium]MCV0371344.1 GntR family transcriptional regulator [Filomicrobium sp.]CFX56468.1 Transcriptional regulator, GntR family protein [Candidatus Filomicrobium marinum]CPR22238.1 Transcriptional regulator, GntR family protein [Candidatus Filomicrobium marinum]SDO91344.1 DNA-binding transcriptional regulator, GntR family [Filomicrobium insigne]
MSTVLGAPIERRPLHEELADQLRRLIIEGDLRPGEKISEKLLCDQFAVSRTPLREALKILMTEGLVLLTPNRGASVTELTIDDLEELFPIIGALEALSGELACQSITDEEIESARDLQAEMVECYKRGDLHRYFEVNEAVHSLIVRASRNTTLAQMMRNASGRIRRARYMANLSKDRWTAAVAEHEAILSALSKRDASRLGPLLKTHIANKFAALREALLRDQQ